MIWKRLRGHAAVVEMFRRAAERNRLAHAYAFCGPEGVGKKLFARTLATCLFCQRTGDGELEACGECPPCRQMNAGSHPDLIRLGLPEGKASIPISAINGGEEAGRAGLSYELSLRPMSGSRRIAIVDDAQHFSRESGNALLKTLEEPPGHAMLILLVPSFDALLPTIRSRCQPIRFAPLPEREVVELLLEHGVVADAGEAETVAALSEGSLDVAAQLLDERVRGLRETLYAQLSASPFDPLATASAIVAGIDELKGDRARQRRTAVWVLRFASEFFREALRHAVRPESTEVVPGTKSFAARLSAEHDEPEEVVASLLDRSREAGLRIEGNSPIPLTIEAWTDGLARTLAGQLV